MTKHTSFKNLKYADSASINSFLQDLGDEKVRNPNPASKDRFPEVKIKSLINSEEGKTLFKRIYDTWKDRKETPTQKSRNPLKKIPSNPYRIQKLSPQTKKRILEQVEPSELGQKELLQYQSILRELSKDTRDSTLQKEIQEEHNELVSSIKKLLENKPVTNTLDQVFRNFKHDQDSPKKTEISTRHGVDHLHVNNHPDGTTAITGVFESEDFQKKDLVPFLKDMFQATDLQLLDEIRSITVYQNKTKDSHLVGCTIHWKVSETLLELNRAIHPTNNLKTSATIPLPETFDKHETGLMTLKEFLAFRNPDEKYHPSNAYAPTIFSLNRDNSLNYIGAYRDARNEYGFYQNKEGNYLIKNDGKNIACIISGVLFYTENKPSLVYYQHREGFSEIPIRGEKKVKYLEDYIALVAMNTRQNIKNFPHVLQRIKIKGEPFVIRSEKPLTKDAGETIVILNSTGEIVATAQNEWNTTLLMVADEYKGRGLGQEIGKRWYQINPSWKSGGFTIEGRNNAKKLWEKRVREFLERGWYSELLKEKRLGEDRIKEILDGLSKRPRTPFLELSKEPEKQSFLLYLDETLFIYYDERFLTDQDEKYIYATGTLGEDYRGGLYIFQIDYDHGYRKLAHLIAFQMAKDLGEEITLDVSDVLELEGISEIEVRDEKAFLTKNVLNLKEISRIEKRVRANHDPYDEIHTLLLEQASFKWL